MCAVTVVIFHFFVAVIVVIIDSDALVVDRVVVGEDTVIARRVFRQR